MSSSGFPSREFVYLIWEQEKHMHIQHTSVPPTHTDSKSDIATLQEISRKFHHVARKPRSGKCCSGIRFSRFHSDRLMFSKSRSSPDAPRELKTLLLCVLYWYYLPLLVSSRLLHTACFVPAWILNNIKITNRTLSHKVSKLKCIK